MTSQLFDSVMPLIGQAGEALLRRDLAIVAIVIYTVKGHFKAVEGKLEALTTALISLETKQSERMNVFDVRLNKLEQNKGG